MTMNQAASPNSCATFNDCVRANLNTFGNFCQRINNCCGVNIQFVIGRSDWHLHPSVLLVKNLGVDGFVSFDHRLNRESLFDPSAAGATIDLVDPVDRSDRTPDIGDEEARDFVLDHLAAGSEIGGDHWKARRVGFGKNQAKSFWNRVEMEQCKGSREQLVLRFDTDRANEGDLISVEVRFDLLAEIGFVLDNAGDDQIPSTGLRDLDRQVDALVGVDSAEKN
jgi:hypothetical protein